MSDQQAGGEQPEPVGYVYFIREVMKNGKGRIKIGWSLHSPDTRFVDINVGSSREIEKFALMRATHSHEQALHKRFAKYWKKGEWFRSHPSILSYITENARDWKEYQAEEREKEEAERQARYAGDNAQMRRQYRSIEDHQSTCWMLGKDPNKTPMSPEPEITCKGKPRRQPAPTRRLRFAPLQALLDQLAADKELLR